MMHTRRAPGFFIHMLTGISAVAVWLFAAPALAKEKYQKVRIEDAYIELHTGAGRGYPVFHVEERGRWVYVLKRRTDWFLVRTRDNREGWVSREQLERTLTEAGTQSSVRDTLFEDYLKQRAEVGFMLGYFETASFMGVHAGWKTGETFSVEGSYAQVHSLNTDKQITSLYLASHIYPDARFSPFYALGYGRMRDRPVRTEVGADSSTVDLASVTLGARFYLTRNFVLRGHVRHYSTFVDDDSTKNFFEWAGGVSFFF